MKALIGGSKAARILDVNRIADLVAPHQHLLQVVQRLRICAVNLRIFKPSRLHADWRQSANIRGPVIDLEDEVAFA